MRALRLLLVLFILPVFVLGQAAKTTEPAKSAAAEKPAPSAALAPSKATVESFLKYMFSYDPNLHWEVLSIKPSESAHVSEVFVGLSNQEGKKQTMRFFVMPDQKWAIAGDMVDMMPFGADPFADAKRELAAKAHGPSHGPADAKIRMVEFSDLECPACKAAQPTIDHLLSDFPQAHFTFENFPLESIHPWSFKAAQYADCVGREKPDAFWKFLEVAYQNQESVNLDNVDQKMKEFATQAGANAETVATCAAQPATAARVRESIALGKAVDVGATPTLFVNGRRIQNVTGIPYDVLKQLVQGTPE